MHVPAVAVRYGLMLEAYCRGCGQYRLALAKQVKLNLPNLNTSNKLELPKLK